MHTNVNELNSACREGLHIIHSDFSLLMSVLQSSQLVLRDSLMAAKLMIYKELQPQGYTCLVDNMTLLSTMFGMDIRSSSWYRSQWYTFRWSILNLHIRSSVKILSGILSFNHSSCVPRAGVMTAVR